MATIRSLLHGVAHPADSSAIQPGLFLLRTEDEWAGRWRQLTAGQQPAPDLPPVDWTTEVVLGLVLGFRPTTGYTVTIEQVVARYDVLEAQATEVRPGGFTGQAVTVPVHVVAVPAADARDDLLLIQRIVTAAG
ncbi:protease complex subunit PrcB family protein [Actinoplanes sp. NPDC024001]|uniref:protease complex subunit PrcB family protein n=1 Tax=Actinoplanes sp. NPDC024001 TaxID=3154598 RepID=UPI0033F19050